LNGVYVSPSPPGREFADGITHWPPEPLLSRPAATLSSPSDGEERAGRGEASDSWGGEATRVSRKRGRPHCSLRLSGIRAKTRMKTCDAEIANERPTILPLPGERAGVRAVVPTNSSPPSL